MFADARSRVSAAQSAIDPAQGAPEAHSRAEAVCARSEDMALVVTEGEALGKRVPIGNAPVVIGRGVGVDLQVRDLTVSRHHCVVWRASGRCWVRDLGSTNETRVNNRSALLAELFDGDVVAVG